MLEAELQRLDAVFSRKEICVLGLPFDVVDEAQALSILELAIAEKTPCFLSTPNLNFAISAIDDNNFRDSVLQSDLSVADGMPLIWLSRLIGEKLPERVAGSSLFERMRCRKAGEPVSVFFFGGMDDVAQRASASLNENSMGMVSVGALNPGIGSVADMSTDEIIQEINAADPDFLVVSLGAKKGQRWILENQTRLNARVLSHLGAVVNFVAGTVARAPAFWQKTGLEWVWRIIEEPGLWKRYFFDGLQFSRIVLTKVLPLAVYGRLLRRKMADNPPLQFVVSNEDLGSVVSLSGVATMANIDELRKIAPELVSKRDNLLVDLKDLDIVDSSFWAFLLRLKTELTYVGAELRLQNAPKRIRTLAKLNMVDDLFA